MQWLEANLFLLSQCRMHGSAYAELSYWFLIAFLLCARVLHMMYCRDKDALYFFAYYMVLRLILGLGIWN